MQRLSREPSRIRGCILTRFKKEQVVSYARGDIGPAFASAYRLPLPKDAPFTIGYTFEGKPHQYLPDVVGTLRSGTLFIAEAGMEDDKQGEKGLETQVQFSIHREETLPFASVLE